MNDASYNFEEKFAGQSFAPRLKDEDALLAFLVGTVHAARAPLAVSMGVGFLITLAAYEISPQRDLVAFTFAHVAVGLGRVARLADFQARERVGLTRRDVVECDRAFGFWSIIYALIIGLTCYDLTVRAASPDAFPLALGACTGFTLAFATRNAGRPWMLRMQVLAVAAPQMVALLTAPVTHGRIYLGLIAALALAGIVLGRHTYERLVALFRADEASRRLASSDMLTGLLNRHAVNQAFTRAIAQAQRETGEALAVYLVDLDRFKEVNDTKGHAMGDAVLVETAARLLATAGPGVEVARMGGDEFMLLARRPRGQEAHFEALGAALAEDLSRPLQVGEAVIPMGASVGAAIYPRHGEDMTALMKHADFALYDAKRDGRRRFRMFDQSLESRLTEERVLGAELEQAFSEDQLEVWYQPIRSLSTGELSGYEALVRWRHPTRGLIFPDAFIPFAEQSGAIARLGEIVLEKACRDAAGWDERVSVAVNVSPRQFRQPEPLLEAVKRALALSGLTPSRLHLEITESFLMADTEQTRAAVNELADLGVRFALDDFGAGYSSLGYIQSYPFSEIKIDRKFVANIHDDPVSSAIVASVCVLAERVRMKVVAEGVETLAQQRALKALGVDLAQGYLYGRPARLAATPERLKASA